MSKYVYLGKWTCTLEEGQWSNNSFAFHFINYVSMILYYLYLCFEQKIIQHVNEGIRL